MTARREELRLCQWNIERGALERDGTAPRWPLVLRAASHLADTQKPDIVWVNEAHQWASTGRAEQFAAAIGAHSWHVATHGAGYDMMLFLKDPLAVQPGSWLPEAHWMARAVTVGLGTVVVPEPGWPPLLAAIVHLSPWGGPQRWLQSFELGSLTDGRGPVILAGDFNCIGADDPEPDMTRLRPSQLRAHKTPESSYDNPLIDRRAVADLTAVGWHDAADLYDNQHPAGLDVRAVDIPTSGFWGYPETFMPCRKAHILLNPAAEDLFDLADYQVHGWQKGSLQRRISDHIPITATLRLHEPAP